MEEQSRIAPGPEDMSEPSRTRISKHRNLKLSHSQSYTLIQQKLRLNWLSKLLPSFSPNLRAIEYADAPKRTHPRSFPLKADKHNTDVTDLAMIMDATNASLPNVTAITNLTAAGNLTPGATPLSAYATTSNANISTVEATALRVYSGEFEMPGRPHGEQFIIWAIVAFGIVGVLSYVIGKDIHAKCISGEFQRSMRESGAMLRAGGRVLVSGKSWRNGIVATGRGIAQAGVAVKERMLVCCGGDRKQPAVADEAKSNGKENDLDGRGKGKEKDLEAGLSPTPPQVALGGLDSGGKSVSFAVPQFERVPVSGLERPRPASAHSSGSFAVSNFPSGLSPVQNRRGD